VHPGHRLHGRLATYHEEASVVEVTSFPGLGPSLARSQVGWREQELVASCGQSHDKLPSALAGRFTREPGHASAAYMIQKNRSLN
jgi:hypothetical protein